MTTRGQIMGRHGEPTYVSGDYDSEQHGKTFTEWYRRGYKAGKSDNPSGCCCEFEGETDEIISMCAAHAALVNRYRAGLRLAIAMYTDTPWPDVQDRDVESYVRVAEELGVE